MNIIIEGPDGAGKTFLANQLSEILGMGIRHFVAPQSKKEAEDQFSMYRDIGIDLYNTIFDRAWYSDMVYGPIFRNELIITSNLMLELERGYDDLVVIYCTGDPEKMWDAARQRGEDYVQTFKQFKEICKRYDDIFYNRFHNCPIHVRRATGLN